MGLRPNATRNEIYHQYSSPCCIDLILRTLSPPDLSYTTFKMQPCVSNSQSPSSWIMDGYPGNVHPRGNLWPKSMEIHGLFKSSPCRMDGHIHYIHPGELENATIQLDMSSPWMAKRIRNTGSIILSLLLAVRVTPHPIDWDHSRFIETLDYTTAAEIVRRDRRTENPSIQRRGLGAT
jgi:hypothetical protein